VTTTTGDRIELGDVRYFPDEFQKITAVFAPVNMETLRGVAAQHIGSRLEFMPAWRITPEDGGDYIGQIAWQCLSEEAEGGPIYIGWVPSEDLKDAVVEPLTTEQQGESK
jgi:hypothetical protein